jgi:gamma-glutamyltranspeptidase/glutathione hydrolase
MLHTVQSYRGMMTAPHHLASQAGLRVLQEGGNAVEAMIAAASTIAVVYPHMNGLGGDNFWLIHTPDSKVIGIDACGGAAGLATIDFYKDLNLSVIPSRGPLSALTVGGAISGWQAAQTFSTDVLGGKLPLSRLLEDSIHYAQEGVAITATQANNTAKKLNELLDSPGFEETFLSGGIPAAEGSIFTNYRLSKTLDHLANAGLDDFYRGDLARSIAADLETVGTPLSLADLERHHALIVKPLEVDVAGHRIFNMPPPTQGLASLILIAVYARRNIGEAEGFDFVHNLVEATKRAFLIRDAHITDPAYMSTDAASYLDASNLDTMAADIDAKKAMPWPNTPQKGDTVWLGATDAQGCAVSFIQSIYWEFGSGTVLNDSGIVWQNRGTSFSLDDRHPNALKPYRRPFHTIQPAMAHLSDGRVMPYGTMGGEGQPQTQAMVFARHVLHGQSLQKAITAPRWLLGRTWGNQATNLRIESRIGNDVLAALRSAGHDVEVMGDYDEVMGHAGAIVMHPDGLLEGANDPRSNGQANGF